MGGRTSGWGGAVAALAVCALCAPARAQAPAEVGQWSPLMKWPDVATHSVLLPTGDVLVWPEFDTGDSPRLWHPATGALSELPRAGFNIFCAGHALLPDGRVLVAGGHIAPNEGLPHAALYDPVRRTWQRTPDMNLGRWYPTNTTLPSGEALVIAGTVAPDVGENPLPQVWQPARGAWRDLTGAQKQVPTYPWMFVAPDGRVFMAGPAPTTESLDVSGRGAWTSVGSTRANVLRSEGSAVMYEPGKVLITGGGSPALASAEVIDLEQPRPAWRAVAPMAFRRRYHNSTLLPDGTVLVTGGSAGAGFDDATAPVLATELWDPRRETFTRLASAPVYRGYHATALLLPDGRVLVTEGRQVRGGSAQLFSPPYLFRGTRPTLARAPRALAYGQAFDVATPEADAIAQVTLVRLGAVTHAFDQNQRFLRLPFRRAAEGLSVTAPAHAALAPPGHYLLFVLDERGVPSVGRVVHLGDRRTPPPAAPVPTVPPGEVTPGELPPGDTTPLPEGAPPEAVDVAARREDTRPALAFDDSGCGSAPGGALPWLALAAGAALARARWRARRR